MLALAPGPQAHLLLTPAVATSLHQSPTGFGAHGIVRGQAAYLQHCGRCHGTDGRGEGPDAAQLPQWPPNLNGALLWKRLDGELFWRVREGRHNRAGVQTMPGVGSALSDVQIWEVLDYLQAHAAGQMPEDDLVCRSVTISPAPADAPAAAKAAAQGDGLEALIRRMDSEPVRLLRGGFPH